MSPIAARFIWSIRFAARSAWCIPGRKGRSLGSSRTPSKRWRNILVRALPIWLSSSVPAFGRRIMKSISPPRSCGNAATLGVTSVNDSGVCTACDLDRYYSYRAEKGRTGRMLAFLALRDNPISVADARDWPETVPDRWLGVFAQVSRIRLGNVVSEFRASGFESDSVLALGIRRCRKQSRACRRRRRNRKTRGRSGRTPSPRLSPAPASC